jgi:hypothetical protein
MLWLVFGGLVLFVFLGGLRAFERASVTSIKALLAWIAALAGISLALLLILTGRGVMALGAIVMFGPLLWRQWKLARSTASMGAAGQGTANGSRRPNGQRSGTASGPMTREEAWQVLGLRPGATEADIRAAHHRLMRAAHPDTGGSDWLAARVNQARDVLLGGRHA